MMSFSAKIALERMTGVIQSWQVDSQRQRKTDKLANVVVAEVTVSLVVSWMISCLLNSNRFTLEQNTDR